jgi:hypothetical protein
MSFFGTIYWIDPAGVTTLLNDGARWQLADNGLHGFGSLKASVASVRRPYRSGVLTLGGPYTPEREMAIALSGVFPTRALYGAGVRALRRLLNPYLAPDTAGQLKLLDTDNAVTRQIDCWCVELTDVESEGPIGGIAIPVFWAPEPWFYDPTQQVVGYALDSGPGVAYPVDYNVSLGVSYATADLDSMQIVTNAGDVETWPLLEILGPGQAPKIENQTTGKIVELSGGATGLTLGVGDSVQIDMDLATVTFYDAYVTALGINYDATIGAHYDGEFGLRYGNDVGSWGINVIEKLSDASEFWPLVYGANSLRVQMRDADAGMMTVSWYNRYLSL